MDKKLSSLYRLGGLTGILSGFLMLVSSIWFIFNLSSGVFHGIGVVTIILLVPTLLAGYGLLSSEAHIRSTLGASFAIFWLAVELIAHCSQTAPLGALSELGDNPAATIIGTLWAEWGEALFMTGAFLCTLLALCYGSALHTWGNPVAGYLFFISIIAFPVGVFLKHRGYMDYGVELHMLVRGIAFLFLGGVLAQAPDDEQI